MVPERGVRYRDVSAIEHVRYREVPLSISIVIGSKDIRTVVDRF